MTDPQDSNLAYMYAQIKDSRYTTYITAEALITLLRHAQLRHYQEGNVILQQGRQNNFLFVMVAGSVAVKIDGQFIYTLNRKGDLFGEVSLITGKVSNADVEANADVEVIAIPMNLSMFGLSEDHESQFILYQWFSRILSDKLERTSEKAKLYERLNYNLKADLQAARRVQEEVFYSNITPIANFRLYYKSHFASLLGGDLFGVFQGKEPHSYAIVIGDVTGHGTASALLALSTWNMFHNAAQEPSTSKAVVEKVNELSLLTTPDNYFITAFYGIYHAERRELVYTNAGHHPGLLLRQEQITPLTITPGLPLGSFPARMANFTEHNFTFEPGDRLLLFTDGVFENMINLSAVAYPHFIKLLNNQAHLSSAELLEFLFSQVKKTEQDELEDDFTLLIFEQTT